MRGRKHKHERKLRVAFVANSLYGGGAERVLQTVLRGLDTDRWDITLVDLHRETPDELYPPGVKFRTILRGGSFAGKVHNKIAMWVYDNFPPRVFRALWLRERFDVEVAFIEGYATRIVAGGRSRRRVAWVHIDMEADPWAAVAFRSHAEQRGCYRRFDRVVCVSQSVRESFDRLFGGDGGSRSTVIYNPVDSDAIRLGASAPAPEREQGVPLLVSVGRLVEQKGFDRLIPIVGRLVAGGLDVRLWIVGEGPQRPLLESLIAEWRLERVVRLWGWRDNPWPMVAAADWFVLSSRWEGYGLVMAEALIAGTPVVAAECAGTREILGDSRSGVVVPNDDRALHDALHRIVTDPGPLAALYRRRAAARARDFSLAASMAAIRELIES